MKYEQNIKALKQNSVKQNKIWDQVYFFVFSIIFGILL